MTTYLSKSSSERQLLITNNIGWFYSVVGSFLSIFSGLHVSKIRGEF